MKKIFTPLKRAKFSQNKFNRIKFMFGNFRFLKQIKALMQMKFVETFL